MKRYAANATVVADGQVLIEVEGFDYESSNNAKLVKNLAGQGGAAFGRADVKGSFNFTVPQVDTERLALIRKYQRQQGIILQYRSAGIAMRADVILSNMKLGSKTDEADTFSMDFIGFEEPVQG
jgi:hypothetical protein